MMFVFVIGRLGALLVTFFLVFAPVSAAVHAAEDHRKTETLGQG